MHKKEDMAATFFSVFGDVQQADKTKFSVAKISPGLVVTKGK